MYEESDNEKSTNNEWRDGRCRAPGVLGAAPLQRQDDQADAEYKEQHTQPVDT